MFTKKYLILESQVIVIQISPHNNIRIVTKKILRAV